MTTQLSTYWDLVLFVWGLCRNTTTNYFFLICEQNLRSQRDSAICARPRPLHTRCFESNRGANKKGDRRPEPGHRLIYRTPCHRYLFYWLPFALNFIAAYIPDKTTTGRTSETHIGSPHFNQYYHYVNLLNFCVVSEKYCLV